MRTIVVIILPLILMLCVGQTHAVEMKGLYKVEIEIADRERSTRLDTHKRALSQILVRISGSTAPLHHPVIKKAIINAGSYIQRYQYHEVESEFSLDDGRVVDDRVEVMVQKKLYLIDQFDKTSIENLLKENGFPVWGSSRPSTLLWLVIEDEGKRLIVGANDKGFAREIVNNAADYRAIPIQLPLLDLTDQNSISIGEIWGGFIDRVQMASLRYQSKSILVGRIHKNHLGVWEVEWILIQDSMPGLQWQSQSSSIELLIASGINRTADQLASVYAQHYQDKTVKKLEVVVEPVKDFSALESVRRYLSDINGVKKVAIHQIESDYARFMLDIEGQVGAVMQIIDFGDVLLISDDLSVKHETAIEALKLEAGEDWARYPSVALYYRYLK